MTDSQNPQDGKLSPEPDVPMGGLPPEAQQFLNKETSGQPQKGIVTPSGFFTGFEIANPEYEVITPQSLLDFTVRSMTVAEEEKLKASLLTARKIPMHLNDVIWDCLVKRPDSIKTIEDFKHKITVKDRDALLYGMYHITYKDDNNYEVRCPKCGHDHTVKLLLSKVFKMKAFGGKPLEILNARNKVTLERAMNAVAILRQPTLADEQSVLDDMLFQTPQNIEMGMEMLPIDRFIIEKPGQPPQEVIGSDNIFNAYKSLPASDRKLINKTYVESFGQYEIDMTFEAGCPSCNQASDYEFDLVNQFFRSVIE